MPRDGKLEGGKAPASTKATGPTPKAASKLLTESFEAETARLKAEKKAKKKAAKEDKGAALVALSLSERIAADPVYKRAITKVENLLKHVDVEKTLDELFQSHGARTIRTMTIKTILSDQQTQLIETNLQNQSFRSRAVELKMRNYRISATVTDALSRLKKYVGATYAPQIKDEGYTTIADRKNYVDEMLADYTSQLSELDVIWTVSEEIIGDLDAAGYSMLRIQGILELTSTER